MRNLWILVDGEPVQTDDVVAWASWMDAAFEHDGRRVALTEVGELTVSTVFLGIDHGHGFGSSPVLYETMILGSTLEYCARYATREQAEAGHARAVRTAELTVRRCQQT